ncbi:MAG: rod shape-determining protein RodA [Bacteroidota bacterium]
MRGTSKAVKFDWLTILLFLALVFIGWINIYSASLSDTSTSFFDFEHIYYKQIIWIGLSVVLIVFILAIEAKFYERFAAIIYLISLASLILLFPLGKEISGATSWYSFGGVGLQPSEFAKAATALALAKYIGDIQTNMKEFKHQLRAFAIVAIPALLIVPQPDPGSALIYSAFVFTMYREGMHFAYLLLGFFAAALFIGTLAVGVTWVTVIVLAIAVVLYLKNKKKRPSLFKYGTIVFACVAFAFSVNYIFNNVFEQRHRDRFNIVLGKEIDSKGIGYNTNQSEIAIGSGGWTGKGWTQGTQTKGNFVPEQHTDYIFSTVGEEWGFLGALLVVALFVALIIRILILAERQRSQFSRVYGYSVAAILFVHFFVNIGMVTGLIPTIGIPLPFFSYGGSSLWGFTILLFIFIRLDGANYYYT